MSRRSSPRMAGGGAPTPPEGSAGHVQIDEPVWRAWMQDLGRRQRRIREFVGLSQDQLALETGKGLATPLLIVLKINAALARELRKVDPALLSTELQEALEVQGALAPSGGVLGFTDLPLTPDDAIEELVRLYRRAPERQRAGVLSVVRAMLGTAKALPLVLAALVM